MPIVKILAPHHLQGIIEDDPHRFRVVACGRRWGKTFMAMREALKMVMQRYERTGVRQRCWVVSPTFPLVREDWLIAETMYGAAATSKKQTEMRMDFGNRGIMEFKSAEREDEGLRGAGLDVCVVDEAARVSRKSWERGIRPALADKLGRCIFISTPKGRNWFYELWLKGQQEDSEIKSWKHPTYTNPFFPESEWKRIESTTPELVLRQEYMADFLEDEGSVFHNIESCLRGVPETNVEGERYTIGVDLGKAEDFTVVTIVRNSNCQLVNIYRSKDRDWSLQKKFIKSIAKVYPNNIVHIDATGLGGPIEEDLRKDGVNVRAYKFTNQSKVALVEQLQVIIEQSLIGIPECRQTEFLIDELKAFTYDRTDFGNMRYHAPEGLHDDGVISLGLAVKGASHIFYQRSLAKSSPLPVNSPAQLLKEAEDIERQKIKALPRRFRRYKETGILTRF